MRRARGASIGLGIVLLAGVARADDPPAPAPSSPPADAPEVVVSATRTARTELDTPVGTSVVRARDIERRPAASTGELLRDQPGVWTNGEGIFYATPNIRGAFGNQTLVMLDGARLNNATAFGGDNRLMQSIDPENIDRIEIVRGPGSVMWGSDALGGLVHVFTKAPPAWNQGGGTLWQSRLSATLGSVDRLQRYRGEVGVSDGNFRARVGITTTDVGDLHTAGPMGTLSPSGWNGRAADARVDYMVAPNQVLSFEAQDNELWGAQSYELAFSRPIVTDTARRLGLVRYQAFAPMPGVASLEAWFYLQQQHEQTRQANTGAETSTNVFTYSGDVQAKLELARRFDLTIGLHHHHDFALSDSRAGAVQTRTFPTSQWTNAAIFALGEIRATDSLSFLVGARADAFFLRTEPDAPSIPAGATRNLLSLSTNTYAPTGSIGVVEHVTKWMSLVASGSRGFRAADISDQVSSGPFRNGYNVPTPGLSPESSYGLEGGARFYDRRRFRGAITGFYTLYRDLIQSSPRDPNPNTTDCVDVNGNGTCDANEHVYTKNNAGKAHTVGVEVSGSVEVGHHVSPYVVGTYMKARVDDPDAPFTFLPPPNATIGVRWEPGRFYVDAWSRLVAPMSADDIPCSRIQSDAAFHVDPRDVNSPLYGSLKVSADKQTCSGTFPGHAVFGVRGGATITSWADVHLAVNNLFDAAYRDKDARVDGAGFGVMGTLTLHEPHEGP